MEKLAGYCYVGELPPRRENVNYLKPNTEIFINNLPNQCPYILFPSGTNASLAIS